VLNCRLTAGGDRHHAQTPGAAQLGKDEARAIDQRDIWFDRDASSPTPVYNRQQLVSGQRLTGPAVIEQLDTTTLLFPGDSLTVDQYLNLIIELLL
jgi:N-methylhydantoinase A